MDFQIDPTSTLEELQLACFMAAITALVELAKTTDKDHIKLRALTEVARLCNPAKRSSVEPSSPKPPLSPRRGGSPNSAPISPTHLGTPSATDEPQTHAPRATDVGSPRRPKPVSPSPADQLPLESLLPLNRRQRRFLARMEANERERAA